MARIQYVESDSGKPSWWTDDGVQFYIGDVLGATRDGDQLVTPDGRPFARVSSDGRMLLELDGHLPAAVEQDLFEEIMGG